MLDQIFDWYLRVLIYWANIFGITYREINVWAFVILWPILPVVMTAIIIRQWQRIRQLME